MICDICCCYVYLFVYVRFEVFTVATMKNGVFWDVYAVWL
jgi:hypothetical protein